MGHKLNIKLPHRSKNTLFESITLNAHDSALRNISFSAVHWPYRTSAGLPDLRYNPVVEYWPFREFVREMKYITELGDYVSWGKTAGETESAERAVKLSKFISVERQRDRKYCSVRSGALYWDKWSHAPLYFWRDFDKFDENIKFLIEMEKNL